MRAGTAPRILGLVALVGAVIGLTGCEDPQSSARSKPREAGLASASATAAPTSATGPTGTGSNPSGRPGPASRPPSSRTSTGTPAPSTPPATVTLAVVRQPTCPVRGTPDAPFSTPGTDVIIEWKVTGAGGAALAVDDPTRYAAYGMYPAAGQLSLGFGCGTGPGTTTHTYTVWPAGIKNVSKTISVSATNNP
ncbi:MAG TPA: hypothetical protein VFV67_33675 [Actinophytocola sp.]|uniref:hypothetical protein n=1 Tax=Actinophytocola sp. TaxID=1872138 RepID=UPI002DB5A0EB|nr:hypothetical protein [Actinophytocola sp.]HEU5475619.1 hypothetical protein [Actinophytocola sp.]